MIDAGSKRLARERKTLQVMIALYCREQHHSRFDLCPECSQLHRYALQRIDRCRFGLAKPTCAKCPVHCYRPGPRAQVRAVMRFAGPRMLLRHPLLSLLHLWDGLQQPVRG
jgi:hypothetical protein